MKLASIFFTASAVYLRVYLKDTNLRAIHNYKRRQPSLCSDPHSCSFDDYSGTPTSKSIDITNYAKFRSDHNSSYLELQYHGNLIVDCIESIAFPYDLMSRPRERTIAQIWKNYGVKVYYLANDSELKQL